MKKDNIVYVGLDVHTKIISAAIAENFDEYKLEWKCNFANTEKEIASFFNKLKEEYPKAKIEVCYEAGCVGYVLYRYLTVKNINCSVIAPTLIPTLVGDKVKTDRKDSLKLAENFRAGMLTKIWVPDEVHESLRDLVRLRISKKRLLTRAKVQLDKYLIKYNISCPEKCAKWTLKYIAWLKKVKFEDALKEYIYNEYLVGFLKCSDELKAIEAKIASVIEESEDSIKQTVHALESLRGISKTTAFMLTAEIGSFVRFKKAGQLMSYLGLVPGEYSSGGPEKRHQLGITKTGNKDVRKLLTESAWNYRFKPVSNTRMKRSLELVNNDLKNSIKIISERAQIRLCSRYKHFIVKQKQANKMNIAIARELSGFIWSIGREVESYFMNNKK